MIADGTALDELARCWGEVREEYDDLLNDAYDRRVLDRAARLAAEPGGEAAHVWTMGLRMMAPSIAGATGRRRRGAGEMGAGGGRRRSGAPELWARAAPVPGA
ncbi:hypothetical protein [Streptomyces sp. Y7]|uniref:hypothetical protein n=1 Tax=Streptomyces sp. Y7 TaxID=3342392 RepID=UPI003718478F